MNPITGWLREGPPWRRRLSPLLRPPRHSAPRAGPRTARDLHTDLERALAAAVVTGL
ncbi:hypothetical protein OG894_03410 [Streptomyces sp. NBC_01724]|uniref:hypothetical protein n=1 Tax=unclassified Streptomyces TaxID=2593676 RepID=UPI002E340E42|nr:hypothetical protein [Streptomyces sp. NBC_01724]WTE56222.1 hypothetical protein OG987_39310 [Streptomyces sp. NBC_01620]WTE64297.1 hypothetical protein OG784_39055 [Streptomyces sp. NBC_01617]WTI91583.1 hypothetical protein OHB17_38375 [Streptomyces sp. NBC_00724]